MLESWRHRDKFKVLEKYFAQGVNNGERVTSLYQAFSDAGIQVDRQAFDDYLAIKYLRNAIIHGRWKDYEREWLDARGFPTDTRKLKKEHLDKIEHVNQNMMLYIALAGLAEPDAPKPAKLVKLDKAITRREDETGILRIRDIKRIICNNLDRIAEHIYKDIEKAANAEQYAWTAGLSQSQVEALDYEECKRLLYLAARASRGDRARPGPLSSSRRGCATLSPRSHVLIGHDAFSLSLVIRGLRFFQLALQSLEAVYQFSELALFE
jgi:hypothetical protein